MKERLVYSNDIFQEIGDYEEMKKIYLEEAELNGWDIPKNENDLESEVYKEAQYLTDIYGEDMVDNAMDNCLRVIVHGDVAMWDGMHHGAYKVFPSLKEALVGVIPDYEATSTFKLDEQGRLFYTESSHDCPMGGTRLYFDFINKRGQAYLNARDDMWIVDESDIIGVRGLTRAVRAKDMGF